MKIKFLAALLLFSYCGFSQNETNILPEEGNVGIGTDSATCKLDVRGQARMEGSVLIAGDLTVTDIAVFQNRLYAQEMLEVTGDAKFAQNVEIGSNLAVENDMVVAGNA